MDVRYLTAVGIVLDRALPNFTFTHPSSATTKKNHPRGSYGSRGYYQPQQAPYAAHYPAKYNPPSYHYPSPNTPVFTPSWEQQQQQPLSSLPKQLSMPAPITLQEPPTESETPLPPPPDATPHILVILTATTNKKRLRISLVRLRETTSPPNPPLVSQNGPSGLTDRKTHTRAWHHHLPKAHPPPDIVSHALHLETPPRLPHLHVLHLSRQNRPSYLLLHSSIPLSIFCSSRCCLMRLRGSASLTNYGVTKTTGTPTQTGSPASLHTSLSVAGTKDGKDVGLSKEANSMSTGETASNISVSAATTVVPTISTASTPTPAVRPSQATLPTATTMPIVPPPSATPKKSWASLLRPSASSSSASA